MATRPRSCGCGSSHQGHPLPALRGGGGAVAARLLLLLVLILLLPFAAGSLPQAVDEEGEGRHAAGSSTGCALDLPVRLRARRRQHRARAVAVAPQPWPIKLPQLRGCCLLLPAHRAAGEAAAAAAEPPDADRRCHRPWRGPSSSSRASPGVATTAGRLTAAFSRGLAAEGGRASTAVRLCGTEGGGEARGMTRTSRAYASLNQPAAAQRVPPTRPPPLLPPPPMYATGSLCGTSSRRSASAA